METQNILRALPLVAEVLGKKYGVHIKIGGRVACTNGTDIHIPALPADAPERVLRLARGFVDHESAHIRSTDFAAITSLSPLEKHIWNIIEDRRVEHALCAIFPGCRENLDWLIRDQLGHDVGPMDAPSTMLSWILMTVRSWDVADLEGLRDEHAALLDDIFPELRPDLEEVLSRVRMSCTSTQEAVGYAQEIVSLLGSYSEESPSRLDGQREGEEANQNNPTHEGATSLGNLDEITEDELPPTLAQQLAKALEKESSTPNPAISVATAYTRPTQHLEPAEIQQARHAISRLRARLAGFLQATRERRAAPSRTGKLNPGKLYQARFGGSKVFLRHEPKPALNTAVHILVDVSGSMYGQISLALGSCFALGSALQALNINTAITAFPAGGSCPTESVVPLIAYQERMHTNISIPADGSTPMGPALWWAMQNMTGLRESRKLILIISDGSPDDFGSVQTALTAATEHGFEVYGIGIQANVMEYTLPGKCRTVHSITELAPAMFELFHHTLRSAS